MNFEHALKALMVGCVGTLLGACAAEPATQMQNDDGELRTGNCLFPATFGQIQRARHLKTEPYIEWTWQEVQRRGLDNDEKFTAKLVDIVSIASPVRTAQDAFAAVEGGVLHERNISDKAGVRTFRSFDFEIQGKTYASIVDHETDESVANFVDGAVNRCTVKPATCVFRESFRATLRQLESVERKKTIRSADGLSEARAAQILAAANVGRGSSPLSTVAEAFEVADESFASWVVRDAQGGETFTAIEYESGNGDTRTAVMLRGDTTEVVATFDADDLEGNCKVLRP